MQIHTENAMTATSPTSAASATVAFRDQGRDRMRGAIVFVLALALFASACGSDSTATATNTGSTSALTTELNRIHDVSSAPGFAVSVVRDGELAYQESFGLADVANQIAYTNQTTQPIASISKTFAAAAIVAAIDQGHFTLETDINDVLPIEVINPKQPDATIQVKHLVTHTSGLIDNFGMYVQGYRILPGEDLSAPGAVLLQSAFGVQQRETVPLGDYLATYYLEGGDSYSEDNFAASPPGEHWEYSNIATSLSAYLIETATGQSFDDYVQANVLEPLGMNNTSYGLADQNAANTALLYWDLETPLPKYTNDSYPDGAITTSNEDLSKFLLDMMKGARGESQTLFPSASYALLFDELLPTGLMPAERAGNQGVFWFVADGTIGHDGGDPGVSTALQFDQAGDSGYLLITNMDDIDDAHAAEYSVMAEGIQAAIDEFIASN